MDATYFYDAQGVPTFPRAGPEAGKPRTKVTSARYKTELCRAFQEKGMCKYGEKCQFAHGPQELRQLVRHPKYKTEMCRTFHSTGLCPYGPRCHFIHNTEQLAPELRRAQGMFGGQMPLDSPTMLQPPSMHQSMFAPPSLERFGMIPRSTSFEVPADMPFPDGMESVMPPRSQVYSPSWSSTSGRDSALVDPYLLSPPMHHAFAADQDMLAEQGYGPSYSAMSTPPRSDDHLSVIRRRAVSCGPHEAPLPQFFDVHTHRTHAASHAPPPMPPQQQQQQHHHHHHHHHHADVDPVAAMNQMRFQLFTTEVVDADVPPPVAMPQMGGSVVGSRAGSLRSSPAAPQQQQQQQQQQQASTVPPEFDPEVPVSPVQPPRFGVIGKREGDVISVPVAVHMMPPHASLPASQVPITEAPGWLSAPGSLMPEFDAPPAPIPASRSNATSPSGKARLPVFAALVPAAS